MAVKAINNQVLKGLIKGINEGKKEEWFKLEENSAKGDGCIYLKAKKLSNGVFRSTFVLRYAFEGERRKIALGNFTGNDSGMIWRDAKQKAEEYRADLRRGVDPYKPKYQINKVEMDVRLATLGDVADLYVEELIRKKAEDISGPKNALDLNLKRNAKDVAVIDAHEVGPEKIAEIIERMIARGVTTQSNRVLTHIKAAYNLVNDAPGCPTTMALIKSKFKGVDFSKVQYNPAQRVKHNPEFETINERDLKVGELSHFFKNICIIPGEIYDGQVGFHPVIYHGVKFLFAIGGDRIIQTFKTPWSKIDLDERMFEITDKKGRGSIPRKHSVYLNDLALNILREMEKIAPPSKYKYPFPSPIQGRSYCSLKPDSFITATTISKAIKRFCEKTGMEHWSGKSIRGTCTTLMIGKCKIPDNDVAKVQGHILAAGNKTQQRNYNKYAYWDEKQRAMEKWADFLVKQGF